MLFVCLIIQNEDGTKLEYRVWNPFRSKLAAAILGGVDEIWIVITLVLHLFFPSLFGLFVTYMYCIFIYSKWFFFFFLK